MPCKRKTEVYSRAVGYYRPVQQWNKGKVAEFHNRLMFKVVGAPAVPLVSRKSDGVRPRGAGRGSLSDEVRGGE